MPIASLSADTATVEGERRQVTVMFCDLVGSSTFAGTLDPEDFREVVQAFLECCAQPIESLGGHIAQYLGDGILVYFGYPYAYEDTARRAVRAGLGIISAIETLNERLERERNVRLATRTGIHTGLVVVGEMGSGGRHEFLALGETPNVAARLESLAEPDTILISDATCKLVAGFFHVEDRGIHELRGISEPVRVWRVLEETASPRRFDSAIARGLSPLVGRARELEQLEAAWRAACAGGAATLLLTGEAGIGKSRLLQTLAGRMQAQGVPVFECRCSAYYENTALHPVIDMLQRTFGITAGDEPGTRLQKLEIGLEGIGLELADAVPLVGWLLSVPLPEDRYPPLGVTPLKQKQMTLELLERAITQLATRGALLFAVEDLHWVDPSTLQFLELLIGKPGVCLLLTSRADFELPWGDREDMRSVDLQRLSAASVKQLIGDVTGGLALPQEVIEQIVQKTDGIPLFVEEQTRLVVESGLVRAAEGGYELVGSLSDLAISSTLQDSLMARLDRLGADKAVAQLGAVLGRAFPLELLAEVTPMDRHALCMVLNRLEDAGLLRRQGSNSETRYEFKHALIQDAAYQSLLKSTRRRYHGEIAQVLEARFSAIAEAEPELLARHHSEAGHYEPAVGYWHQAAQRAVQKAADQEAIVHASRGLELLPRLPEGPDRLQRELMLLLSLGPALMATQGYGAPRVEAVYNRARALCHALGEAPQTFAVLFGLWTFHVVRNHLKTAREIGEHLLGAAGRLGDQGLTMEAHIALGWTSLFEARYGEARTHLEHAIKLYDPTHHRAHAFLFGQEPGMAACSCLSVVLSLLGDLDQAKQRHEESLAIVAQLTHANSLAFGFNVAAWFHHHRNEPEATQAMAARAIEVCEHQSLPYFLAKAQVLEGWGRAHLADADVRDALAEIRTGLDSYARMGEADAEAQMYFLTLHADACLQTGQPDDGLASLDKANKIRDATLEGWPEPEIHRLRGELLLRRDGSARPQAEALFERAIEVARSQGAKLHELRALVSLGRLLIQQARGGEVKARLEVLYSSFTEGRDTHDLKAAHELIGDLEDARGKRDPPVPG